MLSNYLIVAYRNLLRQKGYTFISVTGLSLGLACSLLILLWVDDELGVDRYHEKLGRIHQVMELQTYSNGQKLVTGSTPGVMAPAMVDEFPEVEAATRVTWGSSPLLFKSDDEYFPVSSMLQVDPAFFDIFTVDFVEGSAETAFENLESIVISDELAKTIFGDEPALGKILQFWNRTHVTVSGVFASRNNQSSLKYHALQPFDHWVKTNQWAVSGWGNNGLRTVVLLREGVDSDAFEAKIAGYIKTKTTSVVDLFLLPYAERHLRGAFGNGERLAGRILYVRIFSVVAVFILVIACINFMNLATAKSSRRAKEIGVRKAVGARQSLLAGQFMVESMLVTTTAMAIALIIAELSLPYFNQLTGKAMEIDFSSLRVLGGIVSVTLFAGVLAGVYPALYMASFDAVKILKGSFRTGLSASRFRHGLIVFQFTLSIMLMVVTFVIYRQMDFLLQKDLGLQKENVVYFGNTTAIGQQFEAFRSTLMQVPGVRHVSRSNQNPISVGNSTGDVTWDGMGPDEEALFQTMLADYDFTETLNIPILSGRSFDRSFGSDSLSVLVNQVAARKMGMEDPVGKTLRFWDAEFTVVGLIGDFHTGSLHTGLEPLIVLHQPQNAWISFVQIRPDDVSATLDGIRAAYKTFEQRYPPTIVFLDDAYQGMYQNEATISTLSRWFAGFALFISCLGLFGLATFSAEQRAKEIGVRKVLGASVRQLVAMMTGNFSRLVALAFVIAAPVAWYVMGRWLEGFAYRIELDVWTFALVGLATLAVAWLTVFWQCLRAALVNPVEVLKYE